MFDICHVRSAIEHYKGVVPDIMVMAKGIANGFPLSGIVSRKELMDLQKPGSMGGQSYCSASPPFSLTGLNIGLYFSGTYGGNPVACAAGIACAEIMRDDGILENVNARSKEIFATLNALKDDKETGYLIAEVRGFGLVRSLYTTLITTGRG